MSVFLPAFPHCHDINMYRHAHMCVFPNLYGKDLLLNEIHPKPARKVITARGRQAAVLICDTGLEIV